MSQRIADASAKVARSSYPLPGSRTTSFRPLWDNWPSFLERLSALKCCEIVSVLLGPSTRRSIFPVRKQRRPASPDYRSTISREHHDLSAGPSGPGGSVAENKGQRVQRSVYLQNTVRGRTPSSHGLGFLRFASA